METILLVEDDHDIRVSFRQSLENCGYFIYSVANGRDALSLLEKISPPKLIIVDLGMPIMSGEEFLKKKNANPKLAGIPVLVVTCYQDRFEVLNQYPYLIKPVDLDMFIDTVANCLKSKSMEALE